MWSGARHVVEHWRAPLSAEEFAPLHLSNLAKYTSFSHAADVVCAPLSRMLITS
jgi:hypothetical protein